MTLDEDQAKDQAKEALPRRRRAKRKPAAEENAGASRQEAANINRPLGRALSRTPSATRMSSQPNVLKPKRTSTRASSNTRKALDVQPPHIDSNMPSTRTGLAQKADRASKNLRGRSSSISDGRTAAAKTSKRGRRARSRSRSSSNSICSSIRLHKRGWNRRSPRLSSRTRHGCQKLPARKLLSSYELSRNIRGRRRRSRSSSTTVSMSTASGLERRPHTRGHSSRRAGKRAKSRRASSTSSRFREAKRSTKTKQGEGNRSLR
ncbi:hypothetical protein HPB50_006797 [Hyalomma asiaticum]|uniref:Uncharacterized protein n=1 Tax=Hyalomma asiaticum TaxID=266040 RepID=A0ACB7SLG3_HYAAI|nr:hypothetical protein HPB50_006797 [Hyalomma asiaticum]